MIMRDTVFTLSEGADEETIRASVKAMVEKVQAYVPGYRLKQEVQFERYGDNNKLKIPGRGEFTGIKTSIFLEVEGAGDYLPRSEEHTSALQSLMRNSYAVLCLKNKKT